MGTAATHSFVCLYLRELCVIVLIASLFYVSCFCASFADATAGYDTDGYLIEYPFDGKPCEKAQQEAISIMKKNIDDITNKDLARVEVSPSTPPVAASLVVPRLSSVCLFAILCHLLPLRCPAAAEGDV